MKKILLVLLLGVLLLSGCAEKPLPTEGALKEPQASTITPAEEPAKPETPVEPNNDEPAKPVEPGTPILPEEPAEPENSDEQVPTSTPESLPEGVIVPGEQIAYSAEGPIVYTPKVGEKPKQLAGNIESEFYLCRSGLKEAIGVRSEDGETIKEILKKADDNGLWGDPYDDLPDYELWFADGRVLTYTSSSGIFTDNSTQKAFVLSEADRQTLKTLFASYYEGR